MKTWEESHPKAKLMARKREAILTAAADTFLTAGFARASMEGIAASAEVSIMTLYRHVRNKEDLFQAVILRACDPDDASDLARHVSLLQRPLKEALVQIGMMFQDRLMLPQTVALLRVVMIESSHFPDLAAMAYQGCVSSQEERLAAFLGEHGETSSVDAPGCLTLAKVFISGLIGSEMLRVLLSMPAPTAAERLTRSTDVTKALLSALHKAG